MAKKIYLTQKPAVMTHDYTLRIDNEETKYHAHFEPIGNPQIFIVSGFEALIPLDYAPTFLEADKKAYELALDHAMKHIKDTEEKLVLVDKTSRGKESKLKRLVK